MSEEGNPRRSLRAHKDIDYLGKNEYAALPNDSEIAVPNGSGVKLSSLTCWKTIRVDDLSMTHRIVFGRAGTQTERKKNLSEFYGLDESKINKNKLIERLTSGLKADLQKSLTIFELPQTGTVNELAKRFLSFLCHPSGKTADSESAAKKRGASTTPRKTSGVKTPTKSPKVEKKVAPRSNSAKKIQKRLREVDEETEETFEKEEKRLKGKAAVALPSATELSIWISSFLSTKTPEEVSLVKFKALREAAENHFELPNNTLTKMKSDIQDAIAKFLNEQPSVDDDFTPEPSIAHAEDSRNNFHTEDSREASPSRAMGDLTPSNSMPMPERAEEPLPGRENIRQVIENMLHAGPHAQTLGFSGHSAQPTPEPSIAQPDGHHFVANTSHSQAHSHPQPTPEPSIAQPETTAASLAHHQDMLQASVQPTPEPSIAQPDSNASGYPTGMNSREQSPSRTADSYPQSE